MTHPGEEWEGSNHSITSSLNGSLELSVCGAHLTQRKATDLGRLYAYTSFRLAMGKPTDQSTFPLTLGPELQREMLGIRVQWRLINAENGLVCFTC